MDVPTLSSEEAREQILMAFNHYAGDCIYTLIAVFEKAEKADDLKEWLHEVGSDTESRMDLMHDEPIQTVAKYLGVSRSNDEFLVLNERYRSLKGYD